MRDRLRRSLLAPLLMVLLITSGCEEDVTAVVGTDLPYTLYGLFSPDLDTQWVRVFPIEPLLEPRNAEPLDAEVTSLNPETGDVYVWQDSLIKDPRSGLLEHAYYAAFEARHEHTYEVTVRRSDGVTSAASVTVPAEIVVQPLDPINTPGVVAQEVLIRGNVPRLFKVEITYAVDFALAGPGTKPSGNIVIPYGGMLRKVSEGWMLRLDLLEDFRTVRNELGTAVALNFEYGLRLQGIHLDMVVGNADWAPPGDVFDVNTLSQPGVMDNVENGFGFVGAGYRVHERWLPSLEVQEAAGFTLPLIE